ncbi:MAG TPA: hypothetical protein PK543_01130 [Candidatus Saccharibacteria bacterium]|nr:hypothetical protein [Candidatus Saccharibacteria bacterium]
MSEPHTAVALNVAAGAGGGGGGVSPHTTEGQPFESAVIVDVRTVPSANP